MFLREDQFRIHAFVNQVANLPSAVMNGVNTGWASMAGGDVEAEDVFTRPGGMVAGVNLGGPSKRSDITIKRQYTGKNDTNLHTYITKLENVAGRSRMWVSYQPLDSAGLPNGDIVQINGVLKTVTHPDIDANASAVSFLTLVMAADVQAGVTTT